MATVRSRELLAKLELKDHNLILRQRGLLWFEHVEPSSSAVRLACHLRVDGRPGPGRPKKLTENDSRKWKLMTVDWFVYFEH